MGFIFVRDECFLFNLEAYALLCELAFLRNVDLWGCKTPDGKGIKRALQYMLPYMDDLFQWKHRQMGGEDIGDHLAFQLGAVRLGMDECAEVNRKRSRDRFRVRENSHIGPMIFLPGGITGFAEL